MTPMMFILLGSVVALAAICARIYQKLTDLEVKHNRLVEKCINVSRVVDEHHQSTGLRLGKVEKELTSLGR